MSTRTGNRAAMANDLITGRAYSKRAKVQLKLKIDPDIMDAAEKLGICKRGSTGPVMPVSRYLEGKLMEEIEKRWQKEKGLLDIGSDDVECFCDRSLIFAIGCGCVGADNSIASFFL